MDTILRRRRSLLVRKPIIIHPRLLMRKMLQAIPLRPALRVDIHLIVQRREPESGKIHNLLLKRLPAKPRELDILQPPIELNVLARADFVRGAPDDI